MLPLGLLLPRQLLGALLLLLPRPLDALLLLLGGPGLLGHDRFDGLVDAGVAQRLGQGLQGREGDVADVLEGNVLGHLLQLGNQEGSEGRHGVGRLDEPAHVLDDDAAAALAEGLLLLQAAGQYGTKDGQSRSVDGRDEGRGLELVDRLHGVGGLDDGVADGGDRRLDVGVDVGLAAGQDGRRCRPGHLRLGVPHLGRDLGDDIGEEGADAVGAGLGALRQTLQGAGLHPPLRTLQRFEQDGNHEGRYGQRMARRHNGHGGILGGLSHRT